MAKNMVSDAATTLAGLRQTHLSQSIIYARDGRRVTLQASVGQTVFETVDEEGFALSVEARDYVIDPADLILDDLTITPQVGDTIRETQGDEVTVYEVIEPAGNPCFTYLGHRAQMRIHTHKIDTEEE